MITIYFSGKLEDREPVRLAARTSREALEGLKLQPGFSPRGNTQRYLCKLANCKTLQDLDEPLAINELHLHCEEVLDTRELRGAGGNGAVKVLIGVVFITTAFVTGLASLTFATGLTTTGLMGQILVGLGVSLVAGGIAQMLMPKLGGPGGEEERSYSLQSYPNTVKSGTPVPILVGRSVRWGGHLFTLNITTFEDYESGGGGDVYIREDLRYGGGTYLGRLRERAKNKKNNAVAIRRDSWKTIYRNGVLGETISD